jgi:hypothetical protein
MTHRETTLLPRPALDLWFIVFFIPLISTGIFIFTGYFNTPEIELPPLIAVLFRHTNILPVVSMFCFWGVVFLSGTSRRLKIQWACFSVVAVFLQIVAFYFIVICWFFVTGPKC